MDLAAVARAQVQALDPDQPVFDVRSLEKIIDDDMCGVKVSAEMMSVYAAIALVLAGSGIFALMAYSVSQRRHEIGVRMTLGAQSTDVLQLVVGRALKLTAAGLAIGVPAAWALTRALSSVLLGVIQIDAPVFAGFTLLLALTAGLAAYIPARWATKVDPIVALRYE
jgi:putative ABC transport system permease protein